MDPKSSSSKVAHLPRSKRPHHGGPYLALIEELSLVPVRPVRLVIDCLRFEKIHNSSVSFSEFIKDEIHLWSSALGQRTIKSLFLFHPYHLLAPFELTRVLHLIASKFHIPDQGQEDKNFAVISESEHLNVNHLALSKGLGFSNFQIALSPAQQNDLDSLSKKIRLLREYSVNSIGVQLLHSDCLGETRDKIKQIEAQCQPDYICLGHTLDSLDIVSDNGTSFSDTLQDDEVDVLELGPEGRSSIGDITVENYCCADKYRSSLEQKRLPIHTN